MYIDSRCVNIYILWPFSYNVDISIHVHSPEVKLKHLGYILHVHVQYFFICNRARRLSINSPHQQALFLIGWAGSMTTSTLSQTPPPNICQRLTSQSTSRFLSKYSNSAERPPVKLQFSSDAGAHAYSYMLWIVFTLLYCTGK